MFAPIATYGDIAPLYSVESLADFLDVHPNTVRNMIDRGELDAVRLGRLIRIPRQSVIDILSTDEVE